MIDLTPLDVRKKRGDFRKLMRGYDPSEVDTFLELVAERLEELVKENLTLKERVDRLQEQVAALSERERAVNQALVTAQELREEIKEQAQKEAELHLKEARGEAERLRTEARSEGRRMLEGTDREIEARRAALVELERRRMRFLSSFRQLLERELDAVALEEGRPVLDEAPPVDLDLGSLRRRERSSGGTPPPADATPPDPEADVHLLAGRADDAPSASDAGGRAEPGESPPRRSLDHAPGETRGD